MVDDKDLVRESGRDARKFVGLPGIDHRLQMQPVPADGADAREPPRILHQIGARGEALGRVGVPAEPGAYADHAIIARLRGDGRFGAGGFQRHGGDVAVGDAVRLVQRLQPSRFLHRRRRVPAGLDVHGGDQVSARRRRRDSPAADSRAGSGRDRRAGAHRSDRATDAAASTDPTDECERRRWVPG